MRRRQFIKFLVGLLPGVAVVRALHIREIHVDGIDAHGQHKSETITINTAFAREYQRQMAQLLKRNATNVHFF